MKPPKTTPVKKPRKVGAKQDKDGSQQWESQSFRNTKEIYVAPKTTKNRSKVNKALGKASSRAFTNTGAYSLAAKGEASRAVKKGRKHGAGK